MAGPLRRAAAREPLIEPFARPLPGPRTLRADFGASYAANGLIGLIFAATGPVAVILAVGTQGGLSQAEIASWIFGVFLLNGVLTALTCWLYRQPLAFFWTIPGTVLVGPTLGHVSFAEVVGAFFATGALILVLGLTGWVSRVMDLIPMPIVMAMVAGIFLRPAPPRTSPGSSRPSGGGRRRRAPCSAISPAWS